MRRGTIIRTGMRRLQAIAADGGPAPANVRRGEVIHRRRPSKKQERRKPGAHFRHAQHASRHSERSEESSAMPHPSLRSGWPVATTR